ncbi:DUF6343 family protein [Spongisporangium articulatum]|uniref:DUF6343 family protein n=1 Tax=Spongisporangium articulatum TaxID=3362603 RepID=A0ABW8ANF5_9ACTN
MAPRPPRTGSEPDTARSALGLRLVLATFGLLCGLSGTIVFGLYEWVGAAVLFAAIGLSAAVDVAVVVHRIRQGPHFQPGARVPPYEPARPDRALQTPVPIPQDVRVRRYLALMALCLVLITVAWVWVRTFSTTGAVVMSLIAMVIPPVAAFVANIGSRSP